MEVAKIRENNFAKKDSAKTLETLSSCKVSATLVLSGNKAHLLTKKTEFQGKTPVAAKFGAQKNL